MFSSEQKFSINGDTKKDLKTVLKCAFDLYACGQKKAETPIRCFKIDAQKGLIFAGDCDKDGYTKYPMDITLDMAVEIIWSYLDSQEAHKIYESKPYYDGDGTIHHGWRVYIPAWRGEDKIENYHFGVIIGVEPDWTFYHK